MKGFSLKQFSVIVSLLLVFVLSLSATTSAFAMNRHAAKQYNPDIKNIIILIPDGMSVDGTTLARWYRAYCRETGDFDTSLFLAMDELASGLVRTWWQTGGVIGGIVDSAPAATAMAGGIKTNDKFLGVTCENVPVATILEAANLIGKSTGMIATSNIQHATPAGFSSHINDRAGFSVIAEQQAHNNIDVVFGGGSQFMVNNGRDSIEALKAKGFQYITTRDEMKALTSGRVWGLFAPNAMAYEFDRLENAPTEPSLAEMTAKAIELLSRNENGFFLMVEGSKIDWAAHANDPVGLVSDILAFDDAVAVALEFAKANQNTMLIIASDHGTGGIRIGDRNTQNAAAILPYYSAALHHFIRPLTRARLTGEGLVAKFNANRSNIREVMAEWYGLDDLALMEEALIRITPAGRMNHIVGPMISQRAFLGWTTRGHTGEDVVLYTYLPGDRRITGVIENTDIALIMAGVWGIDLEAVTRQLFNDAGPVFTAKGANVEIDDEAGNMIVTKGNVTLVIPENRNFVYLNGARTAIDSVIVNDMDGRFYVPQVVLDMIPN